MKPWLICVGASSDPDTKPNMKAWLTFFGIWMTEGLTNDITNSIQISVNKNRIYDALTNTLITMGYNYHISKDRKLSIPDETLYNYMQSVTIDVSQKTLPNWVWKLSRSQSKILMEAMILGDDHDSKSNGCDSNSDVCCNIYKSDEYFTTTSIKLANDFQRLVLHAGYSANITKHISSGNSSTIQDVWKISIVKNDNTPIVNQRSSQSERVYHSKEPVYCISVPNEVFYVRKNGKPCWTGNSRSKGPYQLWVRQPLEGRAKNGGHRVGDMEVWSFLSHGVAQTLKERMMECSDKAEFYTCNQCGMICIGNHQENHYLCTICDNTTNISKIEIPYATKLWLQLMIMMGVSPRMQLQNDDLMARTN
jgi:hypothetical protein